MECKGLYKLMRIPSVADALAKRSQNIIAERQEKRREFFWGSRVDLEKSPPLEKKKHTRAEMLQKWKAEKMKKLEEQKKKQKPVFKVGIVQRTVTGSPIVTQLKTYPKKAMMTQKTYKKPQKSQTNDTENERTQVSGVLTRAKAKTMGVKAIKVAEINPTHKVQKGLNNKFCKIEGGKKKQIDSHVFRVPEVVTKLPCQGLTYPHSPKVLKRNERSMKPTQEQQKMEVNITCTNQSLKENVQVEPIPEEISSQTQMVSPAERKAQEDEYRPIVYSPFVTVRSGQKPKRKSKKSLTMDVDEQIKKEEDEFKCRIFSFRKYIECEKKRLLETCDKWKHIYQEFQEVPTDVEGDIDSVIGKTNLLTSDKFMQFKGLIDKCENGDPFVKIDDLQGFQDWVSIEVERMDEEFYKLEKLKLNGWKRETTEHVDVNKVRKKNVSKNCSKKPGGSSNIRSHILAARKLLKEGNGGNESQLPTIESVKAVTPKKNESLLKDVLSSATKKKNESSGNKSPAIRRNSGLEIMIATQKNKFPTPMKLQKSPLLTDFEVLIGKEDTPGRSILKKTPKALNSSKGHVTFKHTENSASSGRSLSGKYFQPPAEESEVFVEEEKSPSRSTLKKKSKTSSKGRVTFKNAENLVNAGRRLSEKYFQPLTDDNMSPMRTILGDLGNITPGVKTRSRTRQMSFSPLISSRVN